MRHALGVILLFVLGSAQATPVVWTLDNIVFDDGGTATGSFIFDADIWEWSDINITTTAGTAYAGDTYASLNSDYPFNSPNDMLFVNDLVDPHTFVLRLQDVMTNSGGTILLSQSLEAQCSDSDCAGGPVLRSFVSGSVTAVPVPAAVWLFGSALAGLGWFRRRQTA